MQSLEELFDELALLPTSARARRLEEIRAEHPALGSRLTVLLHEDTSLDVGATVSGVFEGLRELTQDALLHAPGSAHRLFAPGTVVGGFTIVRMIGQGGAGWVFEAKQKSPSRSVALKILRADLATERLRRRFELEAEHLAIVDHPQIASIYASGTDAATASPWIATEFVPGARSIAEYARELPIHSRVRLFRDACVAVASAHAKGVLHRDLKPTNILVSSAAQLKVIDFGLARLVEGAAQAGVQGAATEAGEILGTLIYMSPEQCRGDNKSVDVRSDVFALGAVLYELLAEKAPREFSQLTIHGAIRAVAEQPIPRLRDAVPGIPEDFDAIVAMACADDPAARYATAADFAADLQRALDGDAIHARVPSVARRLRGWARRHPALAAVSATSILVLPALCAGAIFIAIDAQADRARAEQLSRRLVDQLIPAVKALGMTQDAPAVRAIERAAYDLSVEVNGANAEVTAHLALKQAFDWMKGTGRDPAKSLEWATIAEESATQSLGADSKISLEARCVQAWSLQDLKDDASVERAKIMLRELVEVLETRDDVDTASDCLGALGQYAEDANDAPLALQYYTRAADRSTRINGPRDELTVQARSYTLEMYRKQARFAEALVEIDALLAIQRAEGREHKPWTLMFEWQRGHALAQLNRAVDAEEQLLRAEGLVRDFIGPGTSMRNKVRAVLREVLTAEGRGDEATRLWADVPLTGR